MHERGVLCTNLAAGSNSVHERGILCTNLRPGENFVNKSAILCTNLAAGSNFVHERGILCANLRPGGNFVHETTILCTKKASHKGEATEDVSVGKRLVLLCYELIFDCCKCCKVFKFERCYVRCSIIVPCLGFVGINLC